MKKLILATVKEDEKEEIQNIFERINAIKILSITLAENNALNTENSDLYQTMIKDLQEANRQYEKWWLKAAENYSIDLNILERATIDFSDNNIFINE